MSPAPVDSAVEPSNPVVRLKPGRERSLVLRHPWVFSGAIDAVEGNPGTGATVDIIASDRTFLARGAYSASSQIRARVWTFDASTRIDERFIDDRVQRACGARDAMLDAEHTACRLVNGESDGLPGAVADRYGDAIVIQLTSAGAERWREAIIASLHAATGASRIHERSDAEVRTLEGLPPRNAVILGIPAGGVDIVEAGIRYRVDIERGQKTGFYLDQRDNRAHVRARARGCRVLNAFCYTGGFTLSALAGGAESALSIDSSSEALTMARHNMSLNPSLDASRAQWSDADVFSELRALRNRAAQFDLIVLDPPKFAPTAAHAARAARAYKDINLLALKLLARDGLLATFSCSGGVGADLFQKIVAGAAADAHADVTIVERLAAAADHPVSLNFAEGDYLKGLLLKKRG